MLYTADQQGNYQQFGSLGDYPAPPAPVDIQLASDGYIYVLSLTTGELNKLVYSGGGGNLPPIALASVSESAGVGPLEVTFDATASFDPNQDPLTYSRDFDADGSPDSSDATPTRTFSTLGRHVVSLTVSDGHGGVDTATIEIDVLTSLPSGNLAIGKPTQQTFTDLGALASRAVDGNTDGDFSNGSVTLTERLSQPYWQVDLEGGYDIGFVNLFNRTDGSGGDALKDFWVLVNDVPFSSGNLNAVLEDPGVWTEFRAGIAGASETIDVNRTGRYVRVQLNGGDDVLSLAEVQVFDAASSNPSVTLSVADGFASESGQDPGQFLISRSDTQGDLVVSYAVSGSADPGDYSDILSGSITIADGSSSVTLDVTPIDDPDTEGDETVVLTLSADAAYNIGDPNSGTVTIVDNEPMVVVADYRDDFQGVTFPAGWQYLRNDDNQLIGDPANYVPLQWSGTRWEANGDAAFPDPAPAAYTFLRASGG